MQVQTSVFDVAKYILRQRGEVSTMKLQKLVYYSQAWSLVLDDQPMFKEPIEAWISGPVVRVLYDAHRGMFSLRSRNLTKGDARSLNNKQKATIDKVLTFYGDKNSQWLSDLTHMEKPWQKARRGLSDNQRGDIEITLGSMNEYYSSLK